MKVKQQFSKQKLLNNKKLINGWIHIDSIVSAKIMAANRFDSITIDLQHGMLCFDKCRDIIQIISNNSIFPIVRVPANNIGIINKVIDAGAYGIICPLVNNGNDCQKFLDACYYPPVGKRSFGPTMASIGYDNYFKDANSRVLSIIMIETKESVENLYDIIKNKNLDMLYIGPYDLSISYGISPDKVFDNKKMMKRYFEILKKAKNASKKVAIHCSSSKIASYFLKHGFDMVTVSTDLNILNKGVQEELKKINKVKY